MIREDAKKLTLSILVIVVVGLCTLGFAARWAGLVAGDRRFGYAESERRGGVAAPFVFARPGA